MQPFADNYYDHLIHSVLSFHIGDTLIDHGIELSPAYVDVAINRWQDFTGQTATLNGTDSFAELTARRAGKPCIDSAVTSAVGG